jgi:hypothetical protein
MRRRPKRKPECLLDACEHDDTFVVFIFYSHMGTTGGYERTP